MGKKYALLELLDLALEKTDSDSSRDCVYALLDECARKVFSADFDSFYGTVLNSSSLSPSSSECANYDEGAVLNGRSLEETLREGIVLPNRNSGFRGRPEKRFGARMKRALLAEYNLLRDFYKGDVNGSETL